jgi:hypothetical protein
LSGWVSTHPPTATSGAVGLNIVRLEAVLAQKSRRSSSGNGWPTLELLCRRRRNCLIVTTKARLFYIYARLCFFSTNRLIKPEMHVLGITLQVKRPPTYPSTRPHCGVRYKKENIFQPPAHQVIRTSVGFQKNEIVKYLK